MVASHFDRATGILRTTWAAALCLGVTLLGVTPLAAQRPDTGRHTSELARYLNGVKIAAPIRYQRLAVYPLLVDDVPLLHGRWLTADDALARGILVVREKGGGTVPVLEVENRGRYEKVLLMTGEVIAGGMQTRTLRHDVVLAPGQKLNLEVFCVEARRWSGEAKFSDGSKTMLPQSIQGALRGGGDQSKVWSEVARNNSALGAENASGSLDIALKAAPVKRKLEDVRRKIVPETPRGTVGFIFVDDGRPLGAELFGSEQLARELLPKLLDSYAVDYVLLKGLSAMRDGMNDDRVAIRFFERVCAAGSHTESTPGTGSGIQTRTDSLLGDGVSTGGVVAHFGIQIATTAVPPGKPVPQIIYPPVQQNQERR